MYRRSWTSQVKDLVNLEEDGLNHIVTNKFKIRLSNEMSNVFLGAGEEVVQADHLCMPVS
jgi:hypothetical protein